MKKISVIFSLILIVVFSTGSFFMHKCYLKSYKKEFKSYLSSNKQTTATTLIQINPCQLFTNSTIILWEDDNKEVVYKGVLYDIIHIENKNGKVILTAVSDMQEEELKKQFASIYNVNSNTTAKNPFELLKQFLALKSILYNSSTIVQLFPLPSFSSLQKPYFQLSTVVLNQETPPPDLFV